MIVLVTIKEDKDYLPQQQTLIDLWNQQLKRKASGGTFGHVMFTKDRPKNPKTDNRRIAGIKAESVSYLKDNRELIKMTEANFILLMAKMGIEMTIEKEEG